MAAYAPAAIQNLFDQLKSRGYPAAQLGGIYANKPGYHNARNQNSSSDYSVQRADDRTGDGWAAAALDITLHNPADMNRLTQRLINLTHARDSRVQCLREFFGTVNGRQVTGLDVRDVRWVTSDSTHLWHVHISVYRRYATDTASLNGVANAILGGTGPVPPIPPAQAKDWFDMATEADLKRVVSFELRNYFANGEGPTRLDQSAGRTRSAVVNDVWGRLISQETGTSTQTVRDARVIAQRVENAVKELAKTLAEVNAKLDALSGGQQS